MADEQRKSFLLRVPPDLWKDLEKWAADDLRSVNAQIEFLLRDVKQDPSAFPSLVAEARAEYDEEHKSPLNSEQPASPNEVVRLRGSSRETATT